MDRERSERKDSLEDSDDYDESKDDSVKDPKHTGVKRQRSDVGEVLELPAAAVKGKKTKGKKKKSSKKKSESPAKRDKTTSPSPLIEVKEESSADETAERKKEKQKLRSSSELVAQ